MIGQTIPTKSRMKLMMKFIFPRNDCNFFSFDGIINFDIVYILLGSMDQPSLDITCPNNFPSFIEIDLFGFNEIPNS